MKNTIKLLGSITKKEVLTPIETNILENTYLTEATNPYANYYGRLPHKSKPNSLFVHTKNFYFLEEILGFSQGFEKCTLEKVNVACAHIEYRNKQYPAIRIKNFPDYSQLANIQQCFISQGVELAPKLPINGAVKARINKLFQLAEIEPNIYIDTVENHKGYFVPEKIVSAETFDEIITKIKNNTEFKLFDAAQGEAVKDGELIAMARIFREGIDLQLLRYLKDIFNKLSML